MAKLAKISENFSISDAVGSIAHKVKDHIANMIQDSVKTDSKISLLTEAQVTHSGIVNANYGFYKPEKLRDSVKSWVEPYNKPVLVHHDRLKDAVGRVIGSQYKSNVPALMPKVKNSVYQSDYSYRGLGFIQNLLNVTDAEAVNKVLDGRYLTLSVHGDNDEMTCSVCGQEWVNDGKCHHRFGETYINDRTGEDELCYWIAGNFLWDEVSFVNEPADPFAQIINKEVAGEAKDQILQTYEYGDVTKTSKQVTDSLKRLVKFYVINDSKGKLVEVNEATNVDALYKVYDVRLSPVGIDLKSKEKESTTVADEKTNATPAAPAVEAKPAEVTDQAPVAPAAPAIEDKKPETPAATPSPAAPALEVAKPAEVKDDKVVAPVEDTKVTDEKIQTAVKDAVKPLEDKIKEQDSALKAIADEKKNLTEQATTLQAQIRDMKMEQILDLKESLGTDSYPTVEDRTKAKEAMASRAVESINDQIKDLQESLKKHKRPSPANVNIVGDAGAKTPTVADGVMNALGQLSAEQVLVLKLSGRLNPPVQK